MDWPRDGINFAKELTPDELASFASRCRLIYDEGIEAKGQRSKSTAKWLETYMSTYDRKPRLIPWRNASNVHLPIIRVNVNAHLATRHSSMYSNTNYIRTIPINSTPQDAQDVTDYYAHHLYKRAIPFPKIGYDWSFDSILNGCGIVKVIARKDVLIRRNLRVVEPAKRTRFARLATFFGDALIPRIPSAPPLPRRRKVRKASLQHRTFYEIRRVPFQSFFVPKDAGDSIQWPECRWVFQQSELSWEELLSRHYSGWMIDEGELKAAYREMERSHEDRAARSTLELGNEPPKAAKVVEINCRMPLPPRFRPKKIRKRGMRTDGGHDPHYPDAMEELVIEYLPDIEKVVSIRPLDLVRTDGLRPYVEMRYIRIPGQFWGMGLVEHQFEQQAAASKLFNMMIDYGTLANMPYWFVQPGTDLDSLASIEPGAILQVNGRVESPPRFQFNEGFFLNGMNQIASWGERDSHVTDLSLGVNPSRPNAVRTARGQMLQAESTRRNISLVIGHASDDHVRLFRNMHGLVRDNIDRDTLVSILSRDTDAFESKLVPKKAFDNGAGPESDLDFEYVLNPTSDAAQQEAAERLNILAPFLEQINQVNPGGTRALAKKLYEAAGGQDFDEIWPPSAPAATVPPNAPNQRPSQFSPNLLGGIGPAAGGNGTGAPIPVADNGSGPPPPAPQSQRAAAP